MGHDGIPLRIEATGLLTAETHAYYPVFVNYVFGELEALVPVKRKYFMDKMPYLKIGEEPSSTVVILGWISAPFWERIGEIAEIGNAVSHTEDGYSSLTNRRILVSPDIEGRSDRITRVPANEADGFVIPAPEPDKVMEAGEAVHAEIIAKMLGLVANITDIIYMDTHSEFVVRYLDQYIPNALPLTSIPLMVDYIKERGWDKGNTKVYVPDRGALPRCVLLAQLLGLSIVRGSKWRPAHNEAQIKVFDDGIEGVNLITLDDRADTAGTISSGLNVLKSKGAQDIYVLSTHGIWSGPAISRLQNAFEAGSLKGLAVTNTLPSSEMIELLRYRGFDAKVLDVRPIFVNALRHILDPNSQDDDSYGANKYIFRPESPEVFERLLVNYL